MRIIVPAANNDIIPKLCDAGADDIYVGFDDGIWSRKFGDFSEINRMSSFGKKANISSKEIPDSIKVTHDKGKKIYITLNSPAYSYAEVKTLLEIIDRYQMWQCDGFIASDLLIIEALRKRNYHIKLSTMAGVYNEMIVSFYRKIGIKDIIFPRDVSLTTMKMIVSKNPDITFEAFLMRNGCRYSDSNCLAFHDRKYGAICSWLDSGNSNLIYDNVSNHKELKEACSNNHLFKYALLKQACGLCAISELTKIGINSVKIVGRADNQEGIIEDVRNVKTVIENEGQILLESKSYKNCLYGLNCYYLK